MRSSRTIEESNLERWEAVTSDPDRCGAVPGAGGGLVAASPAAGFQSEAGHPQVVGAPNEDPSIEDGASVGYSEIERLAFNHLPAFPFDPVGPLVGSGGPEVEFEDPAIAALAIGTSVLENVVASPPRVNGSSAAVGAMQFDFGDHTLRPSDSVDGLLEAIPRSDGVPWFVHRLTGGGLSSLAVFEDPDGPNSATLEYHLEASHQVVAFDDGSALMVDGETVIGMVSAPWGVDGAGNPVEVVQSFGEGTITVGFDPAQVDVWPVVLDPTWHPIRCTRINRTSTAGQYLAGNHCPVRSDITARGYYPERMEHFGRYRNVKRSGGCGDPYPIPDRLNIFGVGVVYDFRQACKAHDYCYDLGHSQRLNYANVTKGACDAYLLADMYFDCGHRSSIHRSRCYRTADLFYGFVVAVGRF